jgi:hypothetical protein
LFRPSSRHSKQPVEAFSNTGIEVYLCDGT